MPLVRDFFAEIDRRWQLASPPKVRLLIIGSGALMFQTNYERGTNDSDVFDTVDLAGESKAHLRQIAGRNTELATRRRMYVDIVPNGIPFLPHPPEWHAIEAVNRELTHLEIFALDVVDVVVAKLKPFRPNDKADIDAMIDLGLVPHDRLVARFRSAADEWAYGASADQLQRYVQNLNTVERDMLDVDETEIELPSWI
jgi:hypothetical protein